jgi:hypothetical protein
MLESVLDATIPFAPYPVMVILEPRVKTMKPIGDEERRMTMRPVWHCSGWNIKILSNLAQVAVVPDSKK